MSYFTSNDFFGDAIAHRAKYGTANSTSSDKGTDNKLNNTSEYNHKYYEQNKEKWEDNKSSGGKVSRGHYDPNGDDEDFKKVYGDDLKNPKLNMDTHIKGTDFYQTTNKNGQVVLINGNKKWTLPEGVKLTAGMVQQLSSIDSKQGKQGEAFDKAMKEFMDKNKFQTEDESSKKSSSKSSTKSEETKSESSSSSSSSSKKSDSKWDQIVKKYTGDEESAEDKKKKAESSVDSAQARGKKLTEYYKKKQKSVSHSDFENLGSILVRDLL